MSEPVALKRGRLRAKAMRRREATKRVREFTKWLRRGSPSGQAPPMPSNSDYRIARGERG